MARYYPKTYNFDAPAKVSKKAIAFAIACFEQNSVGELVRASEEYVSQIDMAEWGITNESQYRWAIQAALYAKVKGGSIMDDGRVVA